MIMQNIHQLNDFFLFRRERIENRYTEELELSELSVDDERLLSTSDRSCLNSV